MAEKKDAPLALGYDPALGVPLSGGPGYQHPDSGEGFLDPRFAPLDTSGSGAGSRALKAFIREQTEQQTPTSTVRVLDAPFSVAFHNGRWHAVGVLAGLKYHLTGKDREEVLSNLVHLGQRVQGEAIHNLSLSQEIEIARLCQSGNRAEGISRYLEYRVGAERAQQYRSGSEMVSDPALQDVMAECAYFCWLNSRPDVRDSQEFRGFVSDYAGSRPINFDILDAARTAFLQHQAKQMREMAVSRFAKESEPSTREVAESLEELPDAEVEKIMATTRREYARQVRAGSR